MLKNIKRFITNIFTLFIIISCNAQTNDRSLSYLRYEAQINENTSEYDLRAIIKDLRRDDNIAPISEGGYVLRTEIKCCVFGDLPFVFYENFYFDKNLNISEIKILFTSNERIIDKDKVDLLISDFKELFLSPDTNLDCKSLDENSHRCMISPVEHLIVEYGKKSFTKLKYVVVY